MIDTTTILSEALMAAVSHRARRECARMERELGVAFDALCTAVSMFVLFHVDQSAKERKRTKRSMRYEMGRGSFMGKHWVIRKAQRRDEIPNTVSVRETR